MLIFGNEQYFQDNCDTMAQTDKTNERQTGTQMSVNEEYHKIIYR